MEGTPGSFVLEDYDPSRSPVSYDVMYLPFPYIYMVRCLAGMSPHGLIPSFSLCFSSYISFSSCWSYSMEKEAKVGIGAGETYSRMATRRGNGRVQFDIQTVYTTCGTSGLNAKSTVALVPRQGKHDLLEDTNIRPEIFY